MCVAGGSTLPAVTARVVPDKRCEEIFPPWFDLARTVILWYHWRDSASATPQLLAAFGQMAVEESHRHFSSYCLVVVQTLYYHDVDIDTTALIVTCPLPPYCFLCCLPFDLFACCNSHVHLKGYMGDMKNLSPSRKRRGKPKAHQNLDTTSYVQQQIPLFLFMVYNRYRKAAQ